MVESKLKSTRDTYGEFLLSHGDNERIMVLDADLSVSTKTEQFAKQYSNRFFNVGCAEQNLVGVAAGLSIADENNIIFVSTYSMFLMRAWEQIRNTICHDRLNVKFCVTHSGLTNSPDGSSHQCLEDICLMRSIPGMTVIVPCDSIETEKVLENEIDRKGPCYIRLNRSPTPIITENYYNNKKYELGKPVILKYSQNSDLGIIATGTMVSKALEVSNLLEKDRIYSTVLNISTIKPIDSSIEMIIKIARKTGFIVTIEEHSIIGGIGGTISEILAEDDGYHTMLRIGINNQFGETGTYEQLLDKHGLTTEKIINKMKEKFFRYENFIR